MYCKESINPDYFILNTVLTSEEERLRSAYKFQKSNSNTLHDEKDVIAYMLEKRHFWRDPTNIRKNTQLLVTVKRSTVTKIEYVPNEMEHNECCTIYNIEKK